MAEENEIAFLGEDRVSELWTAVKTALSNYMTTSETNDAIAAAVVAAGNFSITAVDALPETGESNVIYFVPNGQSGSNTKDEYMWINGAWELMGSTKVDLADYWSKSDLRPMTAAELKAILV